MDEKAKDVIDSVENSYGWVRRVVREAEDEAREYIIHHHINGCSSVLSPYLNVRGNASLIGEHPSSGATVYIQSWIAIPGLPVINILPMYRTGIASFWIEHKNKHSSLFSAKATNGVTYGEDSLHKMVGVVLHQSKVDIAGLDVPDDVKKYLEERVVVHRRNTTPYERWGREVNRVREHVLEYYIPEWAEKYLRISFGYSLQEGVSDYETWVAEILIPGCVGIRLPVFYIFNEFVFIHDNENGRYRVSRTGPEYHIGGGNNWTSTVCGYKDSEPLDNFDKAVHRAKFWGDVVSKKMSFCQDQMADGYAKRRGDTIPR